MIDNYEELEETEVSVAEAEAQKIRERLLACNYNLDSATNIDKDLDEYFDFGEKPKKKKKRKVTDIPNKKQTFTTKTRFIPLQERFVKIMEKMEKARIVITFNKHDIKYKEQLWEVGQRDVIYNFERIKLGKPAREAAEYIHGNNKYKEEAESGERLYAYITTNEVVPNRFTTIGYVEVVELNGRIEIKGRMKKEILSGDSNVNRSVALEEIKTVVNQLLEYVEKVDEQ